MVLSAGVAKFVGEMVFTNTFVCLLVNGILRRCKCKYGIRAAIFWLLINHKCSLLKWNVDFTISILADKVEINNICLSIFSSDRQVVIFISVVHISACVLDDPSFVFGCLAVWLNLQDYKARLPEAKMVVLYKKRNALYFFSSYPCYCALWIKVYFLFKHILIENAIFIFCRMFCPRVSANQVICRFIDRSKRAPSLYMSFIIAYETLII